MANKRRTVDDYVQAVTAARGIVSVAARQLGVSRASIYRHAERHPRVQQALDDARAAMVDMAEGQLFAAVNQGNLKAVMFMLRTLGKNRGYVERAERIVSMTDEDLDRLTDEELRAIAYDGRPPDES